MNESSPAFVRSTRDGILLAIHVQPNAKMAGIVGMYGDRLKVALRQPPQDGKANAELVALMAGALRVSRSDIELVRGESSRQKTLRITGLSAEQVLQRLG